MRQRQQDRPGHGDAAVGDRQENHPEEHQTEYRREQAWQDFLQNLQAQNEGLAQELRDAASPSAAANAPSWMQERGQANCQGRWNDLRHALHHPESHHIPQDLRHAVADQVVSVMNHPVALEIQDLQHRLDEPGDQPSHHQSWRRLTQIALHQAHLDLDRAHSSMTAWLDGSRDQELRRNQRQPRARGADETLDPYHSAMHDLHHAVARMHAVEQHARVEHLVTPQGHHTPEVLELLEQRNQAILQELRDFVQDRDRHPHPSASDHDLVTHPEFVRDFRDFARTHMPGDTDRLAHQLAQAPTNREMRQMGFADKKTSNLRDDLAGALSDRPAWLVEQWQQDHPQDHHSQEHRDQYSHLRTGPVMEDFLRQIKQQDFQLWLEMERLTSPQGKRGPTLWDRAESRHPADSRRRTDQLLQGVTAAQEHMQHHHPNTLNNLSHRVADIITIHAQETTARFTDVDARGSDLLQDPGCNNPPDLLDPLGYNELTALLQRNIRDTLAYTRNHVARSTREQNAADLNYHVNLMNDAVRELDSVTHGRSEPNHFIHDSTINQYITLREQRTSTLLQEFQERAGPQDPGQPPEWTVQHQEVWEQLLPNITLTDANQLIERMQQQHPRNPATEDAIAQARQQATHMTAGAVRA